MAGSVTSVSSDSTVRRFYNVQLPLEATIFFIAALLQLVYIQHWWCLITIFVTTALFESIVEKQTKKVKNATIPPTS